MSKTILILLMGSAMFLGACSDTPGGDSDSDASQTGAEASSSEAKLAGAQASGRTAKGDGEQDENEWTSILPLETGTYVREGTSCSAPANANVRLYDGRGISGSATHECRTYVLSSDGNTFTVEQSCIDAPDGEIGRRTSEHQTLTVRDNVSFTLITEDESATFKHCPQAETPDYLQ